MVCAFDLALEQVAGDVRLRPPAPFSLPFRGARHYLHSSDIFPALNRLAQERFSPAAFVESLVLRRQATHQVQACFARTPGSIGDFRIRHSSQQIFGWLVETTTPVAVRVPFDEETAMRAANSGPGFACFRVPVPGYTAFEQLVLLMKVVAPQVGRHAWQFARIDLRAPLSESEAVAFRISETVAGRFFIGDISQAERLIGSAVFMAARNDGRSQ